ncbi:hypothetical protein LCGC14_1110140 [marine sediment metagenome]|uniref:Uncharacterized protein n=1 Tax=marine sediment metagenome TaxID=412755 RepID=A0A0F9QD41_9ZZZZ
MNYGQVSQSIPAWQKISGISMKPKLAFAILKYTKKVSEAFDLAEKLRIALIHAITNTKLGEDVKIEPKTEEFNKYISGLQEILCEEVDLEPIDIDFEEVVNSVDDKDVSLSVSDLAKLEVFFVCNDVDPACPCPDDDCNEVDPACPCPDDDCPDPCPDDDCDCDE